MGTMRVGLLLNTAALLAALLSGPALASSECAGRTGCGRKFCEMKRQLDEAEKNGNAFKVAGLKTALSKAKANCTDKGLDQDRMEDIEKSEADLVEYREDLEKARRDRDERKVTKYRKKIEEEKAELKTLKNAVSKTVEPESSQQSVQ